MAETTDDSFAGSCLGLAGCGSQKLDENLGQKKEPAPRVKITEQKEQRENKGHQQKNFDVDTTENSRQDVSEHGEQQTQVPVSNGSQSGKNPYAADPVPQGEKWSGGF